MAFDLHVFVCTNKRPDGTGCGNLGGEFVCKELKKKTTHAISRFRINSSSCLGHCDQGPVLVAYPAASWYSYFDLDEAQTIVNTHLAGKPGDLSQINKFKIS
jgi:(2Fe-2S) ferredoxin